MEGQGEVGAAQAPARKFWSVVVPTLVLTGLVACSGSVPDCNDNWVEEAVLEFFVEGSRAELAGALPEETVEMFVSQNFSVVAARTVSRPEGVELASCEAEIHGRKFEADYSALKPEAEFITNTAYEVYLTDDGDPYVRSLD